ncbi:MAG: hypothetical protein RLY86_1657 [Pseudomonadota bacterium]|jgi:CheY-like chemotaxis protein
MPEASRVIALCVDDQVSMLRLLRHAFNQLGVRHIIDATSAAEALAILAEKRVDIVTLDWNMPGMDGLTLFKAIRQTEKGRNLPIIMVTANSEESHVKAAIAAGVRLFLRKPITVKDMKLRVEAALGKLT